MANILFTLALHLFLYHHTDSLYVFGLLFFSLAREIHLLILAAENVRLKEVVKELEK